MNRKIKAGFLFGVGMAIFYIAYDLISLGFTRSGKQLLIVILCGIVGGAIAGVIFGLFTKKYSTSRFANKTTKMITGIGEEIVFQTPAHHFKGLESVGGKLYLTNKRLIFKAHKLNIQYHEFSIDLEDIKHAGKYRTLRILNKGLSVQTNKKTERFIVEEIEEWLRRIIQVCSSGVS